MKAVLAIVLTLLCTLGVLAAALGGALTLGGLVLAVIQVSSWSLCTLGLKVLLGGALLAGISYALVALFGIEPA